MFAVAANDVWVVGNAGTSCTTTDAGAPSRRSPSVDLYRVWASADGTVWAGGAAATTLRRSGGTWSVFTTPGTMAGARYLGDRDRRLGGGRGATEEGAIFRWDGAAWQLSHANTTPGTYNGIWAAAPGDVWVVGHGQETRRRPRRVPRPLGRRRVDGIVQLQSGR